MGTKIDELPLAPIILDDAEFAVTQVLGASRTTYKVTASQLSSYVASNITGPSAAPALTPLVTGSNVDNIPIGSITWFAASTGIPTGFKECNGQVLSKVGYANLYSVIGDTFTPVLSANHYRVPDLRGEFIRGWDHGKGVDTGRTFGSSQPEDFKSHTHNATDRGDDGVGAGAGVGGTGYNASIGAGSINLANTGGTETRPRNVALLPCIKSELTITGSVVSLNFIPNPTLTPFNGNVLTYQSSTNTWMPSAVPDPTSTINRSSLAKAHGSILYRTGNDTIGVDQTSHVVSSSLYNATITWKSRGLYTVTFTTPMSDTNYVAIAQISPAHDPAFTSDNGDTRFYKPPYQSGNKNSLIIMNKKTTSFEILSYSNTENIKQNVNGFSFVVFGF